jgi:predicted ATPase
MSMPGRKLNDTERRLASFWDQPPTSWSKPLLRSIEVVGGSGIRGINGLFVPLRHPLTAICGSNGTGKSTILALAALAHHSPNGWFVHHENSPLGSKKADRTYYRFSDFFVSGPDERPIEGTSVTWRFIAAGREVTRTLYKTKNGWGHYSIRPERETDFLSVSRIIPAHEISGVRSTFLSSSNSVESEPLQEDYRKQLSYILGREYTSAGLQKSKRHVLRNCRTSELFTGFNMGSGEACLIALLHILQRMPRGGLLVIEEVEVGLHPQAQARLAQVLLRECYNKKLQIVCSTHSAVFLDSIPRTSRMLIKRDGEGHQIFEAPTTRFALQEMLGEALPEIIIYCEDRVAAVLIEEALPGELRKRAIIKEIGSAVAVIRQGVSHLRSGSSNQILCVIDGDKSASEISGWIASESEGNKRISPLYFILPGNGLSPEKWALKQLLLSPYREEFARQLSCSIGEAKSHIEALSVELDEHDIGFVLRQRTNLDADDCIRRTMRSFASLHPQLNPLREKITKLLT